MHYCGTCKALGTTYGQHTRLLLNHDAVFLAELLTELGGATEPARWQRSFQSRNCFAMPSAAEIPQPVKIAATATVVLTKFKIHDQIVDGGNRLKWAAAKALYADSFKKATAELAALGLQERELWRWFDEQLKREREMHTTRLGSGPSGVLTYLAQPTGAVTATVYRHSAMCIGASAETAELMGHFGDLFGKLVYILDAVSDYTSDIASGAFNAIACSFETEREVSSIPYNVDKQVEDEVSQLTKGLLDVLAKLPMERASVTRFRRRLRETLDRFYAKSEPHREEQHEQPLLNVSNEQDDEGEIAGSAPKKLWRKRPHEQSEPGDSDSPCCSCKDCRDCCDCCDPCCSSGSSGDGCNIWCNNCVSESFSGSSDCCGSGSCDCCSGCGDCGCGDCCGGCHCH